jgi:hypothetical protein
MGRSKYVIVAVSDKYLRSEYCMFELYEILRNSKLELGELKKKIFPIYVENISLNKPLVQKEYVEHWQKEEDNWEILKMTSRNFSDEQNLQLIKNKTHKCRAGQFAIVVK